MASRREFIRLVMMGTGATYAVSLAGCKRPHEIRLLSHPRRVNATPQFHVAHAYLRDGQPLPKPSKTHVVDVVVVGGGMSGLSAAVTLEDKGAHVVLVESEPRPGGAAVSQEIAGGLAPLGSVYFVERTPALDRMITRSGVEPVLCPPDGYDFGTGEIVRELWTDETLHRIIPNDTERGGMQRFRDLLLNMGDQLPLYPLPDELPPELAALDVPAEDWVKQFKSQTLLTVLNAYSKSSEGALLMRTNVYCLMNFYASEFGESFDIPRYTFRGGPGALTKGVAATLQNVLTSHLAVRVQQDATRATVDCIDADGNVVRYIANHVVVAAPKFQVPYLVPELPPAQKRACSELSYAPYMTLHVVSDVPLVQNDVYDTWNLTSEFETDVVNAGSVPGTHFKKHVSSLYLPMDRFARGQLQDPELFARRAADVSNRFISTRTEEQMNSVREIYSWGWGHGLVVPTPGSHNGIAQEARKRFGRIVFAGADNDASPAIENAVFNGAQAAKLIIEE